MNKAERRYVKGIQMCVLYAGGRRKSRKLAKESKGRIPARKAARLFKDVLVLRQIHKSVTYARLYGVNPVTALDKDLLQIELKVIGWQFTH